MADLLAVLVDRSPVIVETYEKLVAKLHVFAHSRERTDTATNSSVKSLQYYTEHHVDRNRILYTIRLWLVLLRLYPITREPNPSI